MKLFDKIIMVIFCNCLSALPPPKNFLISYLLSIYLSNTPFKFSDTNLLYEKKAIYCGMKRKDTPKEKAQVENTPKEDRQEKAKPEENDSQTEPNQSNNNEAEIPEPELAFKL